VSPHAHHHEVGGAWYFLDLVIRIPEFETLPLSRGLPPAASEKGEEDGAEGAEDGEWQDGCESGHDPGWQNCIFDLRFRD
jgi:hypothetical protein